MCILCVGGVNIPTLFVHSQLGFNTVYVWAFVYSSWVVTRLGPSQASPDPLYSSLSSHWLSLSCCSQLSLQLFLSWNISMDTYSPVVILLATCASLFWFGAIENTVSVSTHLYVGPESWLCSLFPAPTHHVWQTPVTPAPGGSAPSSGLYKHSHTKTHTQQWLKTV